MNANIDMGVGMLTPSGGAIDVMEGSFVYNVPSWKPEVTYSTSGGGLGSLQVKQAIQQYVIEDRCKVRLGTYRSMISNVLLDLKLNLGAGDSSVYLVDVDLISTVVNSCTGGIT
jgi:hypothetical protein